MTITVTALGADYEELADWTGAPVEDIRRQVEDDHEGQRDHWIARRDGQVVGAVHPWTSPDGNQRLFFDRTLPEAYGALVGKIEGPCMTIVDESDVEAVEALRGLGFLVARRSLRVEIPVARTDCAVPEGYRVISAADTEIGALLKLDNALRGELPGSEGWESDEQWFREETYDSPFFDPEAYLIAMDGSGSYAGLVRIWNGPRPLPRLGLIGVLPAHRRRGLARSLISTALNALADRGAAVVTAEVDDTNAPSRALLTSFGATPTGAELDLTLP
jgi:RimJ/RimL family protein N-acetyltransferase